MPKAKSHRKPHDAAITIRQARRLALCAAGLLRPELVGLPGRAAGKGTRARRACHSILDRFGYLQLDTVSVAGARSHALTLLSRLEGLHPDVGEDLLRPGEPVFEYWGHEACWMPLDLYPVFEFRRREFRRSPWARKILRQQRALAQELLERIEDEGPLRSLDLEGKGEGGWWGPKPAKRVAIALWACGDLAIRERRAFQRSFDLTHRVIPDLHRERSIAKPEALRILLLKALDGHGWAPTGTLAFTWRLRNQRAEIQKALASLAEESRIVPCALLGPEGKHAPGWIRPEHLELAARLERIRIDPAPRLLSPFDPVLWDRKRTLTFFGFHQVLEIYKPESERQYGYFCLPVLSGEHLVGRVDLRADRKEGCVHVLARHVEPARNGNPAEAEAQHALDVAIARHARSLELDPRARQAPDTTSRNR